MANNNRMKAWVRLDGSSRIVSGSIVMRLTRPVSGNWMEVPINVCCGPSVSIDTTPEDVYISDIILSILCDDEEVLVITSSGSSTTIDELTDFLNANYSYLGTFTNDGTVVTLKLKLEIAQSLCADGELSMSIEGTPTTTSTTTTLV